MAAKNSLRQINEITFQSDRYHQRSCRSRKRGHSRIFQPYRLSAVDHSSNLTPFTPYTLVEKDKIIKDLEQIRRQGYSVDNEEMEAGVRCVAALILDHQGKPAASISITGAAMRVTPDRIKRFGNLINNCALAISRQLGYNPAN